MLSMNAESIPLVLNPINCGFPVPVEDPREEPLNFNELLIKRKSSTYCIRAGGDSMSGAGILKGDILVVDRSVIPKHEAIVVASLEGSFTVKRLLCPQGLHAPPVILHPEHSDYCDIQVHERTDFFLFGVVTAVVRTLR